MSSIQVAHEANEPRAMATGGFMTECTCGVRARSRTPELSAAIIAEHVQSHPETFTVIEGVYRSERGIL